MCAPMTRYGRGPSLTLVPTLWLRVMTDERLLLILSSRTGRNVFGSLKLTSNAMVFTAMASVLLAMVTVLTFSCSRVLFSLIFEQTPPLQLPVAEPLDTHTSQDSSACPLNVPQLFGWW